MAAKKKRRERPDLPPAEMAAGLLAAALENGDDFLVTFETGDEGQRLIHILTGSLITPCMLGTLSNRCELPEHERSCHLILKLE